MDGTGVGHFRWEAFCIGSQFLVTGLTILFEGLYQFHFIMAYMIT